MSVCISRHGEYGEHAQADPEDPFVCSRCFTYDESAIRASLAHAAELEAAVDRVRRMHPRGAEESSNLAPGLWCPGCGEERRDRGFGACRTRRVLDGEHGVQ